MHVLVTFQNADKTYDQVGMRSRWIVKSNRIKTIAGIQKHVQDIVNSDHPSLRQRNIQISEYSTDKVIGTAWIN